MEKSFEENRPVTDKFTKSRIGKCFIFFVILFEVLIVAATIMVGVWMGIYRDGYDWSGTPSQQFSYHPLLIFIGLVFLNPNGMLVYRFFRGCRLFPLKIIHGVIQISALVFAAVGVAAAFEHHNRSDINNMYSLHSWIGLITVLVFGLQWLVGLLTFLLPWVKHNYRAYFLPFHVFFGVMTFIFVIVSAFTGMTQVLTSRPDYQNFPAEGVFGNCLALILGLILFIGVFLVADFEFRRPELSNEEI